MNSLSVVAKETEDTKCLMERLYASMSGFDLAAGEAEEMTKDPSCEAAPTYGEILFDSLKTVLDDLKLTRNDVFYDLGAGIGKVAIQTYLTTPVKKSVGVELSKTRHNKAETIKKELQNAGKLDNNRQLLFLNKNIKDVDLSDATVVFMCSTCFSEKLMETILDKLNRNKNKRLFIITLKALPTQNQFKLEKTYTLPMTWSNGSLVHVYTRV
jgi:precorrin-6B methylase 2